MVDEERPIRLKPYRQPLPLVGMALVIHRESIGNSPQAFRGIGAVIQVYYQTLHCILLFTLPAGYVRKPRTLVVIVECPLHIFRLYFRVGGDFGRDNL